MLTLGFGEFQLFGSRFNVAEIDFRNSWYFLVSISRSFSGNHVTVLTNQRHPRRCDHFLNKLWTCWSFATRLTTKDIFGDQWYEIVVNSSRRGYRTSRGGVDSFPEQIIQYRRLWRCFVIHCCKNAECGRNAICYVNQSNCIFMFFQSQYY